MAERLHIIMPSCKPHHLPRIVRRLYREMEQHPFELRWHLMIQGPEPDPKGMVKVDEGIELVRSGWVWTPSDDALHSPALFRRLAEVARQHPHAGAIVFSEHRPDGSILRARPAEMNPCRVDGSQVFWRREFIGRERHDFHRVGMAADGEFIRRLHERSPEGFVFVDEVLLDFNSLEH